MKTEHLLIHVIHLHQICSSTCHLKNMFDAKGEKNITAYFCFFKLLQAQFNRYWNQNRSCPVNLLYQLSNVVSRLYGYSRQPTTMRGEYAMAVDPGAGYTVNEDGYHY